MARKGKPSYARRALVALGTMVLIVLGVLTGANVWGSGSWAPLLGLDLRGGTQMILQPKLDGTETVTADQITQAVDIIRQRIDSGGVAGAEVTTQGGSNIVVSMPGVPNKETLDAIRKPSEMQFRAVLALGPGTPQPAPTASPSRSASGSPTARTSPAPSATSTSTRASVGSPSPKATSSAAIPGAFTAASATPTPSATAKGGTTSSAPPTASSGPTPSASPTAPSRPVDTKNWVPTDAATLAQPLTKVGDAKKWAANMTSSTWLTPAVTQAFAQARCDREATTVDTLPQPKAGAVVVCDQREGGAPAAYKYILGPVVVGGSDLANAIAGYKPLPNGQGMSNEPVINLELKSTGTDSYRAISTYMVSLPRSDAMQGPGARNQLAATLDSRVIVAPGFESVISDGKAEISGNFTIESARALSQQLKSGALPISFVLQTQEQISPTLGSEQLRYGLIAGLVGLLLVIAYSLFQYRALGFVTIASVLVSGLITYLLVTLLGWSHNYRLDMAGVTGLIVAIGFTADSFIVYFERIRDELREGRSLASAVETAWARAKRTIVISDAVNLVAALVLYFLASANVRGFAFTLGLTTILDLVIVFLFTHPLVTLLARRPFFRDGHPLSGLDPERLRQRATSYAGRGRFTTVPPKEAVVEGSAS